MSEITKTGVDALYTGYEMALKAIRAGIQKGMEPEEILDCCEKTIQQVKGDKLDE